MEKIENQKEIQTKERSSGIDLLKIIAIFLICISHAVQTSEMFVDFSPTYNFNIILLKIFKYFGCIGNIIFIIASSYFLFDRKSKVKVEKGLQILLNSTVISVSIFFVFIITGGAKTLTPIDILRQFLPDLFFNVWFVPHYVIFYLCHNFLNNLINNMDKKQHLTFIFLLILFYFIPGGILNFQIGISSFLGFLLIYFVVAYMKRFCKDFEYSKKNNLIVFFIFLFVFLLFVLLKNFISIYHPSFNESVIFDDLTAIFLLPALLAIFNLFKMLKFKSQVINYLANCSLFVYCIHENILIRTILRPKYYQLCFSKSYDLYLLWIILCGIAMFIISYIFAILYKKYLNKYTKTISIKLINLIQKN